LVLCAVCLSLTGVLINRAFQAGDFEGWEGRGPFFVNPPRIEAGPTETRSFLWEGADELTVNVPAEIVYTQGPDARITVTGPSNRLDRLLIERGEIDIQRRNPRIQGDELRIEVQAPAVRYFEFNSARDVQIRGFDQDVLRIESNGAPNIQVS